MALAQDLHPWASTQWWEGVMQVLRHCVIRSLLSVGILAGVALLGACAQKPPPTLTTPLADQARDVPIDDALAVTTTGAVLDRVTLQRLDGPDTAPSFAVEETRAHLAGSLAPDAHYRLVAEAHALSEAPRPPWQAPEPIALNLTREFSTVHAPLLQTPSDDLVAYRGKPIHLRFSEPLA